MGGTGLSTFACLYFPVISTSALEAKPYKTLSLVFSGLNVNSKFC